MHTCVRAHTHIQTTIIIFPRLFTWCTYQFGYLIEHQIYQLFIKSWTVLQIDYLKIVVLCFLGHIQYGWISSVKFYILFLYMVPSAVMTSFPHIRVTFHGPVTFQYHTCCVTVMTSFNVSFVSLLFCFFWDRVLLCSLGWWLLLVWPSLNSNLLQSSSFSLPGAAIVGMHYDAWLNMSFGVDSHSNDSIL